MINESNSNNDSDKTTNGSNVGTAKKQLVKNQAPPKSTLIETITARLNLLTEPKAGAPAGPLGSLFNKSSKKPMAPVAPVAKVAKVAPVTKADKPMAPVASVVNSNLANNVNNNLASKSTELSRQSDKSHAVDKSSPRSNTNVLEHDDTANNALSDLNTVDCNNKRLNVSDDADGLSINGKSNWKPASNFGCSLYGLDTDEDERSSIDRNLILSGKKRKMKPEDCLDSSLPLPPPPVGFDDNNNQIENDNDYENIDFNLIEQMGKEFLKATANHLNSSNSKASYQNLINNTTSMSNDHLNEEPTK